MDRAQLISTITGNQKVRGIVMKAVGAFMRGESPSQFMKNLAMTEPALQGYSYDDIDATAAQVCKERNADINTMKADIAELANSYIK